MYTVLMAAATDAPYTAEALSSIYAQTLPPERVIVLVNGPGATGCSLSRMISAQFHAVEVVESDDEVGMVPAFNTGLSMTSTDYVAFLDTDDLWTPAKQERQVNALREDPDLDAVYALATNFRDGPDGTRISVDTAPAKTFTNTTFPMRTFERFGRLDASATHFSWLYRWWGEAHSAGIRTRQLDEVMLWRRIHGENSWITDNTDAKQTVLAEVRRLMRERRAES